MSRLRKPPPVASHSVNDVVPAQEFPDDQGLERLESIIVVPLRAVALEHNDLGLEALLLQRFFQV